MDSLIVDLNKISKEDAVSVATSLLYSLKGFPQYAVTSELSYILDYENFIKLVKYYGGMTIRIPTTEEINDLLSILLLYQYYEVEGLSWSESLSKSGIDEEDSQSVRVKLINLKKILSSQEIGGRDYD